jgi:hypothetical protein
LKRAVGRGIGGRKGKVGGLRRFVSGSITCTCIASLRQLVTSGPRDY